MRKKLCVYYNMLRSVKRDEHLGERGLNWIQPALSPSVTAAVEVGIGVLQELLAVDVQTVYVVPGVAHVALDPLHRVLLRQPAPRRRARLHCPRTHLLFVLVVIFVLVVGGRRGGARGGGGRGGGRGRRGGGRGQGRPARKRVFPGAASSLAARKRKGRMRSDVQPTIYSPGFHFSPRRVVKSAELDPASVLCADPH